MSLYQIDQEIRQALDSLYDRVDENGEIAEITDEDMQAIAQLKAERHIKLENIALYSKNCDAEAAAIEAEIIKLNKRKERLERKAEGLRGLILRSMLANGDTELSSARYSAKISKSKSTEILDESLIPDEFFRVTTPKPKRTPDKMAIRKAIDSGRVITGARVVENQKVNII